MAIGAFNAALTVFTRKAVPETWALMQVNLGRAYWDRIRGDRAENQELAIGAFKAALTTFTRGTLFSSGRPHET